MPESEEARPLHASNQGNHRMDPEEAKQIAKCIDEALTDAGIAGRANQ
jgi:hypothetical protein